MHKETIFPTTSRQNLPDLEAIFRCPDQSTLSHNYLINEDPPAGAWSYHTPAQSPMGRVAFPEVLEFPSALLYTREDAGMLGEHHVTARTWTPWRVELTGARFSATRAISKDIWFGRVCLNEPGSGLLVVSMKRARGLQVDVGLEEAGLRFRWADRFECLLEIGAGAVDWLCSDNPEALRVAYAGREDTPCTFDSLRESFREGRLGYLGIRFDHGLAYSIRVVRPGGGGGFPVSLDAAARRERDRWETFFREEVPPPPTPDPALRDLWYFSWLTLEANRCEGGTEGLPHAFTSPTRFHYGSQWWWDEVFHCGVLRRRRKNPGGIYDSLDNFFEAQREDGAIPGCLRFTGDPALTREKSLGFQPMPMQPPVIGFLLGLFREVPGWPEGPRLQRLYAALRRHAEWLGGPDRDPDADGLAEYRHSFDSSGDQSPRWDSAKRDPDAVVGPFQPIEPVDMNVWICLLWTHLADMATRLGDEQGAASARRRAARVREQIESLMWDDADGFYYDIDARSHEKIRVKTPYGFMPLLLPAPDAGRSCRLVDEHLLNADEFWCAYPLPSTSLDDPAFDPRAMWRGPTWINVNWLVIHGLENAGYPEVAEALFRKTAELVGSQYDESGKRLRTPRLWEWFHPHTGTPLGNHHYGWSALVADLLPHYSGPGPRDEAGGGRRP